MRTTLNIDDEIIEAIMQMNKGATRSEAVREALKAYVRQKKKEQLLALRGKIDLVDNWRQLRELEKTEL